ncbi:MAG: cyclic nucleotide-binding domain-containing protein [Planctomycetaceae bacterium]|nr:cyclic nucleotide-binding domain-containing protein [Planctomycetaceae bacterium]
MAMNTQQIQQALIELRFTAGLSEEDQQRLAEIAAVQDFPKGAVLISEGSEHRDLHIIRTGRVEVCLSIPARGCLPVLTLEPGDIVGWSSILKLAGSMATVITLEETQTISLETNRLRILCDQDHDIGYRIMERIAQALSQRLIATRLQMLDIYGLELFDTEGQDLPGDLK